MSRGEREETLPAQLFMIVHELFCVGREFVFFLVFFLLLKKERIEKRDVLTVTLFFFLFLANNQCFFPE